MRLPKNLGFRLLGKHVYGALALPIYLRFTNNFYGLVIMNGAPSGTGEQHCQKKDRQS